MAAPVLLITPGWNKAGLVMQPRQRIQGSPLRMQAALPCHAMLTCLDVAESEEIHGTAPWAQRTCVSHIPSLLQAVGVFS